MYVENILQKSTYRIKKELLLNIANSFSDLKKMFLVFHGF